MAETFKKLAQGLLPDSVDVLYSPSGVTAIIKSFRLSNVDSADHAVTLYQDGTDDEHTILPATTIPAGGSADNPDAQVVDDGGTIQGFADVANKVSYAIFGLELS